ncbi:MAG: hypothetical protein JSS82_19590 [Bacteroidetes bacterium]|nr:hypothetical protein [Bacteroidota bacterium]
MPDAIAAKTIQEEVDWLWHKYAQANNATERVRVLAKIGDEYVRLDEAPKRDSVFGMAVQNALLNDSLLMKTYYAYFRIEFHYLNPAKCQEFATEMLSLAKASNNNEWLSKAYSALAIANITSGNIDLANDYVNKAYYHVSFLNNDMLKVECMLLLGYCKELASKKIEAFRSYSDALYLAEKVDNDSMKADCYERLAGFYSSLKKYDKAIFYVKRQMKLLVSKRVVDSNKLMDANICLADYLYHNKEIQQAENITESIIRYAKASGCEQVKDNAFGLYRTYLIDNSQFNALRDLYQKEYPDEYEKIARQNKTLYYRLNGYILEANGKPDSAGLFYDLAEDQIAGRKGVATANFYKRYGEFMMRRGNIQASIRKFDSAYKYALAANYFPYLIETTHYLDSLNYLQKDVDKAYQFAILNKQYTEQQAEVNKGEEMLQLEVENEARQQELRVQMEEKETERRHNLQYTGMVIAIISFFILLTLLGTFKVHPGMIRALGFFSFIFFFEFITMIADHRIHDYTHGEPWKFMAFKIVLIAGLLPLHHWLEEKVIHYLVHHRMLDSTKLKMKIPAIRKRQKPVPEQKPSDN